ncbi:DUF885 domain-containing protein [Segetibacter aerophilus]|uniref:DUF885 domain-containing protein n=1 Tax=Segetibacter aerophilus TaxID=670293 RepID=A0A512BBS5_9BACT|nr:DUF885 domain-containing protein [Segetibacter aerophilus]GEO09390.1 hypothetical protein SAE01_18860 [Segetibacter aerophilus]
MKRSIILVFAIITVTACKLSNTNPGNEGNKELSTLLNNYYEERLKLYPLEATGIGDARYNNLLPIEFTNSYRDTLKDFYNRYLTYIGKYDRENLNQKDKLSYDDFKREMEINLEGLKYQENYIPFQQFWGLPLTMGQLGSGAGNQPFKTVKDYDDWLSRAGKFPAWADSSIVYFRKGITANYVLPKALVVKMIPQMEAMQVKEDTASLFFDPVRTFPSNFSDNDKSRLKAAFANLIHQQIKPAYKKLGDFLSNEYLPKARATSGISALPNGKEYYQYLIRSQTTTNKTPEEIYQLGLSEVARIGKLQDSVKNSVGFKGNMNAFFEFMKNDKQFMPYKSPAEVLAAFEKIHQRIEPNLKKMFNHVPKTAFEIRQTEAFRAASASAEYNQGSPDGARPGIFYVPILDATTFNSTSGMESLFLHEAIPGHHYQISLQQEDTTLPRFRRFGGNNAYIEGWALYCESLGKELGLYTDPYQYMAALGDEIHRAIRLVVDVGLHTKNMTREEAIKYMMEHEAISEQGATAEIERYMAIPGQALGYKIGALKIAELRNKYQKELGSHFNLANFHDNILKDGALPLDVLEKKMDEWAKGQKK